MEAASCDEHGNFQPYRTSFHFQAHNNWLNGYYSLCFNSYLILCAIVLLHIYYLNKKINLCLYFL